MIKTILSLRTIFCLIAAYPSQSVTARTENKRLPTFVIFQFHYKHVSSFLGLNFSWMFCYLKKENTGTERIHFNLHSIIQSDTSCMSRVTVNIRKRQRDLFRLSIDSPELRELNDNEVNCFYKGLDAAAVLDAASETFRIKRKMPHASHLTYYDVAPTSSLICVPGCWRTFRDAQMASLPVHQDQKIVSLIKQCWTLWAPQDFSVIIATDENISIF